MESIADAAARLLRRIEQRAKKGCRTPEGPAEIQNSAMPLAEKEAGEIGAYSSLLAGHVLDAANDNRRFVGRADFDNGSRIKGFTETTTRPAQDDGSVSRSRGNIWLLDRESHALGEW